MGKILGIDLGTTNSAMAVMQGGEGEIIANAQGSRTTPSVAAIDDNGKTLVGTSAKNQMVTNAKNTFYSVKRFIGRRYDDETVKDDLKKMPYEVRKSSKDGIEINFNGEWVAPEVISAKVLGKLKADAESFLGEKVTEAVITVPAYFDDSQRQATKNAGKIAGFDVKRIINEPTAAALAYGLESKKDELIAVYDLGGGTFDISILEIGDDVFEVKATNGDTHLGGDDFDSVLIDWIAEEFNKENDMTIQDDPVALQRLKEGVEKAKIELSSSEKTTINLPYLTADQSGPKHLNKDITRSEMEKLVSSLIDKTLEPCKLALKDAGVDVKDINEVILVGGMTRMPLIQKKVQEFFGKEPHKGVNPDEVVAVGAAIQGGVFTGETKDITLLDVTPLTLGIETKGEVSTPMIPKNTTIPTEKSQVFSTAAPNQPAVEVHVLQGERTMAKDNKSLGNFILDGIPPAPAGVPQIEVAFKLDANGILNVSATDKATNKEQSITITASTQLSEDEINKMVEEAAKHAKEDETAKQRIETKNTADSLVFQTEKTLDDLKDKVEESKKDEIKKISDELKELIGKDDFDEDAVKTKTEELSGKMQEIAAQAYQSAEGQPQPEADKGEADQGEGNQGDADEGTSTDSNSAEEGEIVDEDTNGDKGKSKKK